MIWLISGLDGRTMTVSLIYIFFTLALVHILLPSHPSCSTDTVLFSLRLIICECLCNFQQGFHQCRTDECQRLIKRHALQAVSSKHYCSPNAHISFDESSKFCNLNHRLKVQFFVLIGISLAFFYLQWAARHVLYYSGSCYILPHHFLLLVTRAASILQMGKFSNFLVTDHLQCCRNCKLSRHGQVMYQKLFTDSHQVNKSSGQATFGIGRDRNSEYFLLIFCFISQTLLSAHFCELFSSLRIINPCSPIMKGLGT